MFDFLKNLGLDFKSIFCLLFFPAWALIKKTVFPYIKEWTKYLTEGIMFLVGRYIKQSLLASLSLKRYCKLQLGNDKFRYLYVPSISEVNIDIDKVFVNLTISYHDGQENDFNHKDFLEIGNRIKIMGDPGSGKSSLIKRVFRDECERGFHKNTNCRFPVLIELKNIELKSIKESIDLGKWFYEYIRKDISQYNVYKIEECFESYAGSRGLLVLLDGLDEVSTVNYKTVMQCINKLSAILTEKSSANKIVLTMRTQFYQQIKNDYRNSFPHSTFLKPFTPSDIYEFLSRWHFKKEAEKNIARVYKTLTDRPTLREMCSNPLVLAMYVAEDQATGGNISPESRTQFYRKVTDELIIKRRQFQLSTGNASISYSTLKEQRERIFGKIAHSHLLNFSEPRNTLNWENAITIIMSILKCDQSKAINVFNELAKETGLITEEKERETFRFIHLTFCEFLAAFEVAQGIEDGWNILLNNHKKFTSNSNDGKSRLIEVIPFAAGLLPRINREKTLNDIVKLKDLTLMSRCFLETKLYAHECWNEFIVNSKEYLLKRSSADFDEKWLQDLHIFNVVVKDAGLAALNLNIELKIDLSHFYEEILQNEKNKLHKILTAFASQDAASLFGLCEICNINLLRDFPGILIQNCDQLPLLGLIRDKIIEENKDTESWAAILAESALQKKLVSNLLYNIEKSDKIATIIKNDSTYRIWYFDNIADETFLTQCISLASKTVFNDNHKNLRLLMRFKSPLEDKLLINFRKFFSYVTLITLSLSLSLFIPVYFSFSQATHEIISSFIYYPLLVVIIFTLYLYSAFLSNSDICFYRCILNISSSDRFNNHQYGSVIGLFIDVFFNKNDLYFYKVYLDSVSALILNGLLDNRGGLEKIIKRRKSPYFYGFLTFFRLLPIRIKSISFGGNSN